MSWCWFSLRFPSELETDNVLHFVRALAVRPRRGLLLRADPVVCEVESSAGRLSWRVGVTDRDASRVLTALRLALPSVRHEPLDSRQVAAEDAWEVRTSTSRRSLRIDVADQVSGALLAATQRTAGGESVIVQWLIGPWLHRGVVPPAVTRQRVTDGLDLDGLILNSEQARALRDKYKEPLFGAVCRVGVRASSTARRVTLRQGVVGALQMLRAPGVGLERRLVWSRLTARRVNDVRPPLLHWPCVLNASELASCLGWPIGNPSLAGVSYRGARQLPPPSGALTRSQRERVTGEATFPGQSGLLRVGATDALHHLHIIGPTGVGKSTLTARLALADIEAGRSVVVVDPKRDMVRDIAERIPEHRRGDVVWLDPTDSYPVGLNVLGRSDVAVDAVMHVISEQFDVSSAPRLMDVLRNSLTTLARVGDMTLCELVPLLTNPQFRRSVTRRVRHDVLGVAPFWQWFDSLSDAEQAVVVAPVLNKLRPFTNNVAIRGVIGQLSGFDPMELFTKRKVLLVSLAKDEVGSGTAYLFGSLLISQLWSAIQRRSHVPPSRRHSVFVYVDEFGEVMRLPISMPDALAASRGLGVGWTLAHQDLSQLTTATRAAVLANARSRIAFQLGHDDAVVMARVLGGGLTPQDLTGLDAFETYQALCVEGRTAPPASARTLPLPSSLGTFDAVRTASRANYGRARADVDADLIARRTVQPPHTPVGRRKRGDGA